MENSENKVSIMNKIEPITLIRDVLVNWWCIILGALAAVMVVYIVLNVRYVPEYTTSATFVVSSRNTSASYSSLSSAYNMAQTFQKIVESSTMQNVLSEAMGVDEIDADISTETIGSTNLMELNVTSKSPKDSFQIMQTLLDNYQSVSYYSIGDVVLNVLEEPEIPFYPDNSLNTRPVLKKTFGVAAAVLVIIFGLFSVMKDTLKREEDIEEKLDTQSLGAIVWESKYKSLPEWIRHKKKALLISDPLAGFEFVESYKKLSSKIQYGIGDGGKKVIAVTSLSENEGKSTVAANLAICLAQQNYRVVLVDGDLRRPSQFLIFGVQPQEKNEIGEYLKGSISKGAPLMNVGVQHLYLFGGRNCYSSSTDILQKKRVGALLKGIPADYIIIDTPPLSVLGDAEIWAQHADATLIVARQNFIYAEDINNMIDRFREQNSKVIGVVLNGVVSLNFITHKTVGRYSSRYGYYRNYTKNQRVEKNE